MKKSYATFLGGAIAMVALSGVAITANAAYPTEKSAATIMRANCASCHGQKGEGGTSWVDPSQRAFNIAGRSVSSIKRWTRDGRLPEMPAFPVQEISDTELTALANYINKLPGSYIPEPTANHTVEIFDEDPWYSPMQLRVNAGDTVKYINRGKTYHPVTQIEFVANGNDVTKGTDSGQLGSSRSSTLYGVYFRKFDDDLTGDTDGNSNTRTIKFLCKIHPYMQGEICINKDCTPPVWSESAAMAPPAVKGVGEVWYNAQWQDWPGKTADPVDGKVKDGVVHVIDAATMTDKWQIPVGNNPHNIWMGKGNTKALTTNWYDNTVSVMSTSTKTVLGEYIAGAAPAHVTSDFVGDYWYISIEGSYYVQPFKQSRMSLGTAGFISGSGPHGIWYGGGKLVTSNSLDHSFSVMNAATMTSLCSVKIGIFPLGASANTTGTLGASGNYFSASVSIIDLNACVVLREVTMPGNAVQVPFTPDDKYIVAANSPNITIIDVTKALAKNADGSWTYTDANVRATVVTGKGAHGIAFGPNAAGGKYAYVSHKYENYMSVVDITNPMSPVRLGDVPIKMITAKGRVALPGITDTGGNAIATNPNPAPWQ